MRYEPFNQGLIKVVRDKEFGPLKVVISDHGFNIGIPISGGSNGRWPAADRSMDIGIYSLNAARYVTGEEPIEVNAIQYTTPNDPRFTEVEETINFQLRFPSGVLANCSSSYGAPFNRIRAVGTDGWPSSIPRRPTPACGCAPATTRRWKSACSPSSITSRRRWITSRSA